MYKSGKESHLPKRPVPKRLLDKWILIRLDEVSAIVKKFLDSYKINEASKELENFVDDFSRLVFTSLTYSFSETYFPKRVASEYRCFGLCFK